MEYIFPSIVIILLLGIFLALRTIIKNLYIQNDNMIKIHSDIVKHLSYIANK